MNDSGTSCGNNSSIGGLKAHRFCHCGAFGWWVSGAVACSLGVSLAHAQRTWRSIVESHTIYADKYVRLTNAAETTIFVQGYGDSRFVQPGATVTIRNIANWRTGFSGLMPGDVQEFTVPTDQVTVEWHSEVAGNIIFEGAATVGGGSHTANLIRVERGSDFNSRVTFDPVEITVMSDGSDVENDLPSGSPSPSAPLSDWEGRQISVPIVVEEGQEEVVLEVGGKQSVFEVESDDVGGGDLAFIDFTVPADWDGTATIDGEQVSIASRTAYTGDPRMEYVSNAYQSDEEDLPPGMSRMDSGDWEPPEGVTPDGTLSMPEGVSKVDLGAVTGGNLPAGVSYQDGSSSWTYNDVQGLEERRQSDGTQGSAGYSVTGPSSSGDGVDDAVEGQAIDAGTQAGFAGVGEQVVSPDGLASVGGQWETLKTEIDGKFGSFSPLGSGAIPTVDLLEVPLDFGELGEQHLRLDFSSFPFPPIRFCVLVCITFQAGMSFLQFIKV